jgi:Uma2 family endonuclease
MILTSQDILCPIGEHRVEQGAVARRYTVRWRAEERGTMAAERQGTRMSVDAWRALERESSDVKHEYIDGYVYAMAGGTQAHAQIAGNAYMALRVALGDGPCMVYMSDVATRLAENRYIYPDLVVVCEGSEVASRRKVELDAPRIAFEVLSDSTERYDRTRKFAYYRHCETMREYVLVNTESQLVEVYRRTGDGWGLFSMYGPGEEMELTSVGVRIPVATVYRRTDVPELPPE